MYSQIALIAALLAQACNAGKLPCDDGYIQYTTVTGYFLQDDPATNATTFNYTTTDFGLINREYDPVWDSSRHLTQWQKFERRVDFLNTVSPRDTVYKVLFMGRHGEGYHNTAESYYGTPAWNCYWSLLNGNGTSTWADAALTPNGIAQAELNNRFWRHQFAEERMPHPQSYYTSPLTRCLQTANVTFFGLPLPERYPFIPTVKELFREGISLHTCDHRRSKSYIHSSFPTYEFEAGFVELDPFWNGVTGEPPAAENVRSKKVLDQVFSSDEHTWISITSHSGEIGSILEVLGHRSFPLNTGAIIPVLVKAKFLPHNRVTSSVPFTTSTHCASPPITSLSTVDQGCVCTNNVEVTTPLYSDTPVATAVPTKANL